MIHLSRITVFLLGCTLLVPALAQRAQLDDSLSPRQMYSMDLTWDPQDITRAIQAMLMDEPAALPPLTGRLPGVDIRLNTRNYVGRTVRIYLTLPVAIAGVPNTGNLELQWQATGEFVSGAVRPGQETVIYEGVIDQPVTAGVFDFLLRLEGGDVPETFVFEPNYEIEIIS